MSFLILASLITITVLVAIHLINIKEAEANNGNNE